MGRAHEYHIFLNETEHKVKSMNNSSRLFIENCPLPLSIITKWKKSKTRTWPEKTPGEHQEMKERGNHICTIQFISSIPENEEFFHSEIPPWLPYSSLLYHSCGQCSSLGKQDLDNCIFMWFYAEQHWASGAATDEKINMSQREALALIQTLTASCCPVWTAITKVHEENSPHTYLLMLAAGNTLQNRQLFIRRVIPVLFFPRSVSLFMFNVQAG